MNESFFELPEEKRERIVNAGLEVFSQNDYKHAVTDDIAAKAGISKGLLFYYFHNKQSLYQYLLTHVIEFTEKLVLGEKFNEITDFFELLEYAAVKKMYLVRKMPFLLDFVMKAYFSDRSNMSSKLSKMLEPSADNFKFNMYFKNVNTDRFKAPEDMYTVLQMMSWMGEGYLLEQQRKGNSTNMDDFIAKFREWSALFKSLYYKEEYL